MLVACAAWTLGVCGCSSGEDGHDGDVHLHELPDAGRDTFLDTAHDTDEIPDEGHIENDTAGDQGPDSDTDAVEQDVTGPPVWIEIGLPFPDDYVFKGLWGDSAQSLVVVGAGPIAYGYDGFDFKDMSPLPPPPILNGVWGSSPEDLWMVGMSGGILHYTGGWDGDECANDEDCESAKPCVKGVCVDDECVMVPDPQPGCCGFPSLETGFDDGQLDGFVVEDLYEGQDGMGGIVWNVVSHTDVLTGQPRHTSAPYSLYFGIPDKECDFDPTQTCPDFENGQIVGATVTSPLIELPAGKSAELKFQVFIDSESSSSYDQLMVKVVKPSGIETTVWEKAEVGGTTGGVFAEAVVDMTKYTGQAIRLRFHFDSVDSLINNGEGVFIDDVTLTTTCGEEAQTTEYPTLFGVSGTGPDDVFAVGADGAVIHYDGKSWQPMGIWGLVAFYGLCSDPETGLWAVGSGGTVVRLVDGVFTEVPSGVTESLFACESGMLAVGAGGVAVQGTPEGVQSLGVVAYPDLEGVSSLSDGHSYAVGKEGTVVEFLEGQTSIVMVGDGVDLHAVYAAAPKAIWAVGEAGTVVRFNGISWASESTGANQPLYGVHGAPSGKVLAVGGSGAATVRENSEWTVLSTGVEVDLYAIRLVSENEAWMVGGGGAIVHWLDGVFETIEDSPTDRSLYALAEGPDDRLYASGLGVILALDGDEWHNVFSTTDGDLRDVFALDKENVFAVGKSGTVLRFDGKNWARETIEEIPLADGGTMPFSSGIFGVWASDTDDLWAVAESGTWLHSDGGLWTAYSSGEEVTLRSVHGLSDKAVWMVGGSGTVIHYDGTTLSREVAHPVATLYSVFATGDGTVFAVGDTGTILMRDTPVDVESE